MRFTDFTGSATPQIQNRRIVVLGGGITGLTAAEELARAGFRYVMLLESAPAVGGLASTTRYDGVAFDTRSHRVHSGYEPEVDALIRELCGPALLRRERNGKLFLGHKAISYPPSAIDM